MANPSPHPMNQPKSPMLVNKLSRIAIAVTEPDDRGR